MGYAIIKNSENMSEGIIGLLEEHLERVTWSMGMGRHWISGCP